MTGSDELISKADALLGRSRRGSNVPQPTADYPVLTDIVVASPEITAPAGPAGGAGPTDVRTDPPGTAGRNAPSVPLPAGVMIAAPDTAERPRRAPVEPATAAGADTDAQALEEHVRRRVIDAIEPYIRAFLEEPLRLRIEQLVRDLSNNIAREARDDILRLVRDAIQRAVAREIDARRKDQSDRR